MTEQDHQAMWPQMIAALAAIDAALGLPEDGCNSTGRTLAEIEALRKRAEDAERRAMHLATAVMTDTTSSDESEAARMDAARWRVARQCARRGPHGTFDVDTSEPHSRDDIHAEFTASIDAAIKGSAA